MSMQPIGGRPLVAVVLKWHPAATAGPCAVCREPTTAAAGLGLFAEGTGQPVCHDCARLQAPPLAMLLDFAEMASSPVDPEDPGAQRWAVELAGAAHLYAQVVADALDTQREN
jgi:hypothetical protein